MKASEMRSMSQDELKQKLDEMRQTQFNLRFQLATNQLENTSRTKEVKKDIARIMTIINERKQGDNI